MARYVALLRGINLGRTRRIAMADLRTLLADLGYAAVRTLLNSGNAVLTGDPADPTEHAARIEAGILDRFGMDVPCVVLTPDTLRTILGDNPFGDIADNGSRMMAHVYLTPVDPALVVGHPPAPPDPERARVGDHALYQWCPDGLMAAPDVRDYLAEHLRTEVTARNWNTLTKLATLL